ncbi:MULTISPECIES: flagellar basal-body MS-ring/collar protein FliF [Mameliella]|uniref:Flagellar M-ring protein n=1 Tax=Mameliella alba TaxID=561184 RepID=A0A0B3RWR6_9RHOB|nr:MULTISPECIES: flagellar basal-body MS-ring/collar protein FliF [Mameliella]ODM45994.1 flagellar M-ring protein FliF [Ruegeria sp. PBVC088]KHQ52542.1 Flagellar M-ring protein [Mameliella alba]MDD9733780.1 flagellar basal-body MS-ring/collar protein FliF [Mameliella sp. AT18]OWV47034.1 flagellar M-ring protein FliF [Mameliella alba]PTR37941.1 flagellar M-ring protein FliF [Mameliella alba]
MNQVLSSWNALAGRQRMIVIGATVVVMLAVLGLTRLASAPNMALLYAGLENDAAGDVVKALEARGVQYDVRAGAIFVPEAERDALRLTLASEGLPANSGQGYELLDGLSGFGTTSQMFDAAYWRAKEGELARTIVSNPQIASARVHIANSSANPFQRDVTPTASISVTTTGAVLNAAQARALKFLVASAVPGLIPENVAVIDGKGGLIGAEDKTGGGVTADDRAALLRDRVQRLMEARVGSGNAVVEVSVDTVTELELIRQHSFDPDGRVIVSTDTEERTDKSENLGGGGDVTVASNLPDGGAGGGPDQSSTAKSETRERINYEISETTREITRQPGAIKRLTVAVLVNGSFEPAADGSQTFVPLPDTELEALRDLVASAVGFDETRGDQITLRSMPFERPDGLGTGPLEPGLFSGSLDMMRLIQMGVLAVVALILGLFVLRPILSRGGETVTASAGALPAPGLPAEGEALEGEIEPDGGFDNLPVLADGPDFGGMGMVDFDAPAEEDPVERLRNLIEARKTETVEILRSWLEEDKEDAT